MNTTDYNASIIVEKNPEAVSKYIKDFKSWWSEDIKGNTDILNETFFYHYKDVHLCKLKLIEDIPNEKIVYHVIDNQFSFTKDKTEWTNTKLIFEITSEKEKTVVKFTHEGLSEKEECYQICFEAWTNYIKKSLYNLITTGKGNPNPKDSEGFNASIVEKWKLS